MKYELWESETECSYTFFPEDNGNVRKTLEPNAKLLKVFEANGWNDAMRQKHEFLGWEPYKPMDEEPPGYETK